MRWRRRLHHHIQSTRLFSSQPAAAAARAAIRNCTSVHQLQNLHALLLKKGLPISSSSFIHNALLHTYAKLGAFSSAIRTFHLIPPTHRDAVDWTALIASLARHSLPSHALRLFCHMYSQGVEPDHVTMVALFSSCAQLLDHSTGAWAHQRMIKTGLPFTPTVGNSVTHMYVECGRMADARRVFGEMSDPTVVSWTVILVGAVKWEGLMDARKVFDEMPERNEVGWTVMIVAYVEGGYTKEALSLLVQMIWHTDNGGGAGLNHVTICTILSACAQSGDLVVGRLIHVLVTKGTSIPNLMVGTALLDMYCKCGRIDLARTLFDTMTHRNIVTWNSMLCGLAMHGRGFEALTLFENMRMARMAEPDDVTMVAVLSACSHSGLVDHGCHYFRSLGPVFGIVPKMEHYACMVDLLGRAGRLREAEAIVSEMPFPPNDIVLGSLLASGGLHADLQLVDRVVAQMNGLHNGNTTEYGAFLSNMYSANGKWDEGNSIRQQLKTKGVRKVPAVSRIHSKDGHVHEFTSGDRSHPQSRLVYDKLQEMNKLLRLAGYVPDAASLTSCLFSPLMVEEEKEEALLYHSERLTIAFGLLSTRDGAPLRIFKNLRICRDCHSAIKVISEIYRREIVVRDRSRFHCFKDGCCSCSDYW